MKAVTNDEEHKDRYNRKTSLPMGNPGTDIPKMKVYRSNTPERLAEALADVLTEIEEYSGTLLFEPEMIIVGSHGTERWLSHHIAQRIGVCAGIEFLFPGQLIRRSFAAVLGKDIRGLKAWTPNRLVWSILDVLPRLIDHQAFEPLRTYLGGERSGERITRRGYQLARRIAETFDRYLAYRIDMVLDWEHGSGDGEDWQPQLWRALSKHIDQPHLASLAREFFARTASTDLALPGLPQRLFLFGVTSLPPFYVKVLESLSIHRDVALFIPSPTQLYWAEMKTEGEIRRLRKKTKRSQKELHIEQLPPLLDSFGQLFRDFQGVLLDITNAEEPRGDSLFARPQGKTMLEVLQSDLLDLVTRSREIKNTDSDSQVKPAHSIDTARDDSIRIHACHGPMRQVEVLRDVLLGIFNSDIELEPRHVVVMTPDLDTFAPLIDAVFSDGDDEVGESAGFPRIPYQIADRSLRAVNPVWEALLAILEVAYGRFESSHVVDLLSFDAIRERFDINLEDLPLIREWIRASGIAWGIDEEHRERLGQPRRKENTWRFGLDRLLLGVAMRGQGQETFQGVLPYDEMEGDTTPLLGRFAELIETLLLLAEKVKVPRKMSEWSEILESVLSSLIDISGDRSGFARLVRNELETLLEDSRIQTNVERNEKIDIDALLSLLENHCDTNVALGSYLSGRVTVCGMVPMRSIPFEVVCLLGMDDGAYPRVRSTASFDLIEEAPQRGDRSLRNDDRSIFLEALLSARKHLILFYTGRSVTTNEKIAPAVPVEELLDVLDQSFTFDSSRDAREVIVKEHPLQAFSPHNFGIPTRYGSEQPTSFDRRILAGAKQLYAVWNAASRNPNEAFLDSLLYGAKPEAIAFDDLLRFFRHPVKWFLEHNLSLRLELENTGWSDREPIELGGLEKHLIGADLLEWELSTKGPEHPYDVIVASGRLPLGTPSLVHYSEQQNVVRALVEEIESLEVGEPADPIQFDLELATGRLSGQLDNVLTHGLLRWQFGKIRAHQRFEMWLRHLALCAADAGANLSTIFVGRGVKEAVEHVVYPHVPRADAEELLDQLYQMYLLGQEQPILFFPSTSQAYAVTYFESLLSSTEDAEAEERAQSKARFQWSQHNYQTGKDWGEGTDPWVERILGSDPLCPADPNFSVPGLGERVAHSFHELALDLWRPLWERGVAGSVE